MTWKYTCILFSTGIYIIVYALYYTSVYFALVTNNSVQSTKARNGNSNWPALSALFPEGEL